MAPRSVTLRLIDMVEAIDLVTAELDGVALAAFATDRRRQWIVERGIEIISEASRHLDDDLKQRHPSIPWRKVAGIGNILRHEYQRTAYDVLWHVVRHELPPLAQACRRELERDVSGTD